MVVAVAIASGTTVPGRVLDSADKPRPGVRCNPCAFATASRRAPRANSATSNWKVIPQRDPVRDRFSGAGEVRADGADCCTETGSGCGIKRF